MAPKKNSDFPPLLCIFEKGRLVPASQFDAERMDSFRSGTKVKVIITETESRPGIRKWWTILSLVCRQCNVPWKRPEHASEAIKLALGITNLSKDVGGERFIETPKSLTELDDPELDEAVEDMIALLSRMTGMDVSTLKKETAHEPGYREEQDDVDDDEESPLDDSGLDVRDEPAQSDVRPEGAEPEAESVDPPPSEQRNGHAAPVSGLIEVARKFKALADDHSLDVEARLRALDMAKEFNKGLLPVEDHKMLAKLFYDTQGLIKGRTTPAVTRLDWAMALECEPDDLWRE